MLRSEAAVGGAIRLSTVTVHNHIIGKPLDDVEDAMRSHNALRVPSCVPCIPPGVERGSALLSFSQKP
jgi:hypothetical protein